MPNFSLRSIFSLNPRRSGAGDSSKPFVKPIISCPKPLPIFLTELSGHVGMDQGDALAYSSQEQQLLEHKASTVVEKPVSVYNQPLMSRHGLGIAEEASGLDGEDVLQIARQSDLLIAALSSFKSTEEVTLPFDLFKSGFYGLDQAMALPL
jgi:hypothetical protein